MDNYIEELNNKIAYKKSSIIELKNDIADINKSIEDLNADLSLKRKSLVVEQDELNALNEELLKCSIPKLTDESFKSFVEYIVEQAKERDIDFTNILGHNDNDNNGIFSISSLNDFVKLYDIYITKHANLEGFFIGSRYYDLDSFLHDCNLETKSSKRLILRLIIYKVILLDIATDEDINYVFECLLDKICDEFIALVNEKGVVTTSYPSVDIQSLYPIYRDGTSMICISGNSPIKDKLFSSIMGNWSTEDMLKLFSNVKFKFKNFKN